MGKRKQQQPKKSKKRAQLAKLGSDQQAQVDDVMAWGRKRQNYYRQDEDEYSELSEQERQAQQIYENRYENYLNDEGLYDIPEGNVQQEKVVREVQAELDQDEESLPEEYIRQELEWVLELFKDLEFYEDNELLKVYRKLLKSYLTLIVSIKELKIPYMQYHPIVPLAVDIKTKIARLMKKLTLRQDEAQQLAIRAKHSKKQATNVRIEEEQSQEDIQGQDFDEEDEFGQEDGQMEQFDQDQMEGQQDWSQSQQKTPKTSKSTKLAAYPDHCTQAVKTQKQQHKKGLQYYQKMKQSLQEQKKVKKQQKRQQRLENKKPAFKQTNENQGRFASELILKNKGLMKKRKKIEGNSRVKLRKKYQKKKAIHRARSGHFVRENPGRAYQGQSNIRTGKIAGVRLK